MTASTSPRARRVRCLGSWGFAGERLEPAPAMLAWLAARFASGPPVATFDAASVAALPAARRLVRLSGLSTDPLDRLAHARGQGLPDLLRLRSGTVRAAPDGVLRPADVDSIRAVLAACATSGARLVPWGGGTSVTGGVNSHPGQPPTVVLDLERLSGLESLDLISGLATFGAGTTGPEVEEALAAHGASLGHFPQSWELSTVGGWIATRASGQESMGFGRIEDLVAGLEAVAPVGTISVAARPAAAVGPDPLELLLGSEGRLGIVTRATLRIRPRPEGRQVRACLLPDWATGIEAARRLAQDGPGLAMLRLSDEHETEVALATGLSGHALAGSALRAWLRLLGRRDSGCLLLVGTLGAPREIGAAQEAAADLLARFGAVSLGASPGRRWLADRFRHPYLRDTLLDRGIATDTLETSAPWSRLATVADAVRSALPVPVLCHVSHLYRDGASLYFTIFFPAEASADETITRWAQLKRAATSALLAAGGTLSHHHGVGSWHAPWVREAQGEPAVTAIAAAAHALDPQGTLNPGVLLDPADRLEE